MTGAKLALAVTIGLLAFASSGFGLTSAVEIFELIDERLLYMEDVALYKARNGLPVEDRAQEQRVIAAARAKADAIGLDSESVIPFYEAQIAAAKAIQYRCLADWLSDEQALAREAKDLSSEVRPALLEIRDAIAAAIHDFLESGDRFGDAERGEFLAALSAPQLTERDKMRVFDALSKVRLAP